MRYLNILFIALVISGCASETKEASEKADDKNSQATEQQKDTEKPKIYTAEGYVDGYLPNVYIAPKDEESIKNSSDLPEFDVLHVVPINTESDGVARYMSAVNEIDYALYGVLENFTGEVAVFYDKEKRLKAATFKTKNGKPEGLATVYTPKGRIWIEREYENGKWVRSVTSPACADWTYNANESLLHINDLPYGERTTDDGVKEITLIPSVLEASSYSEILDKSSYVRPFRINGRNFTGRLLAYATSTLLDDNQSFELNFKDGKLHGDVKVYDELFGLTLHEVFDSGELAETVYILDMEGMDGVAKPILYFYPEDTTKLMVTLSFDGELTHTYPKYKDHWQVTACPDGTLYDSNGQEYYALYWEGENRSPFTLNDGMVVKGENTVAFLEKSLAQLGLNRREANEFIMYWLPRMEDNPYNLIHFSTEEYEAMAELQIHPEPETLIRVMMVFEALEQPITIPEQSLETLGKERIGFTVVEWGGKEVKRSKIF